MSFGIRNILSSVAKGKIKERLSSIETSEESLHASLHNLSFKNNRSMISSTAKTISISKCSSNICEIDSLIETCCANVLNSARCCSSIVNCGYNSSKTFKNCSTESIVTNNITVSKTTFNLNNVDVTIININFRNNAIDIILFVTINYFV